MSSAARLAKQGGAALLIDYGHARHRDSATRCRLCALTAIVDPLVAPGECDLTAHVDFAAMARSASAAGAAVYGPIDQGDFLRAIGIDLRTKALAERATLDHAEEFERARARLVGKGQGEMGALFKAMAIADRRLRPPPGFQSAGAKVGVSAAPFLTRSRYGFPVSRMAFSPASAAFRKASTLRSTAASARGTRRRRSPRTAPGSRPRSAPRRSVSPCRSNSFARRPRHH